MTFEVRETKSWPAGLHLTSPDFFGLRWVPERDRLPAPCATVASPESSSEGVRGAKKSPSLWPVRHVAGRSGGEGWRATAEEEWHTGGLARVPFGNVQAVMKSLNQTTDRTRSVASKAAE